MGMHLAGVTPSHGVKYRIYADAPKVTGIRNSQNGVFFASVACFSNLETATKRFDAEFYAQRSMRATGSEPNLPVIVVTPLKCIPIFLFKHCNLINRKACKFNDIFNRDPFFDHFHGGCSMIFHFNLLLVLDTDVFTLF